MISRDGDTGLKAKARRLLKQMLGEDAEFRDGQWEAIEEVVQRKQRLLVVQRTGWGKSLVYFLATRLLRDRKTGPTVLISPLLSLMRNQIEMAERIGIRAASINSANQEEWEEIEAQLERNEIDILLISPERLNNDRFLTSVLALLQGRIGLFVVDEVHCISDWGHDFRPDYRRIARVLQALPPALPVLGTTATANDRVVADLMTQVGRGIQVLRGPLTRASLRLQTIRLGDQSERLAWLAEHLPRLSGSGVVYCLTVADTQRVARWLQSQGINAHAYYADVLREDRIRLEQDLIANRIKALVATVALGMGFDKPDLGFVVHYQRPGSVVAYYQQVGRAGRAIESAYGILLSGKEDDDIQEYFIRSAFPPADVMLGTLDALSSVDKLGIRALQSKVNVSHGMLEKALKLLEIDGAVGRDGSAYFRTPNQWKPDSERMERVTAQRYIELAQMQEYVAHQGCLMEFLACALDDPDARTCGRCANCTGTGLPPTVRPLLVAKAKHFLQHSYLVIEPRKQWPSGVVGQAAQMIPASQRCEAGRMLSVYGDAGWGQMVKRGKYVLGRFDDDLVEASVEAIREWNPSPAPRWITSIPSLRHPNLVPDFARRLAARLGLPYRPVLAKTCETPPQKEMQNSAFQATNVKIALEVSAPCYNQPVMLIDDIVDSRWTMTVAGWLLRTHGSGPVFPFTLATAASGDL